MIRHGFSNQSHYSDSVFSETKDSRLVQENSFPLVPSFKTTLTNRPFCQPVLNSIENFSRSEGPISCSSLDPTVKSEKIKNISVEPFSTARLLPTRHQTKNAVLSILKDGEVCIEFLKKRTSIKKDIVCEVMRISSDGLRIILYEPKTEKGVALCDEPLPLPTQGADKIYGIHNLPEKHKKKYNYASKFVDLVRAKTPKITYYTDKAKCFLMESLKDFEICFYDGNFEII